MRWEVLIHEIIESNPAFVPQLHQQGCGKHLGHRPNLEEGVDLDGFVAFDAPDPVSLGIDQLPAMHHAYGSPGDIVLHEKPLHHPIDQGFEAGMRRLSDGTMRAPEDDKACRYSRKDTGDTASECHN